MIQKLAPLHRIEEVTGPVQFHPKGSIEGVEEDHREFTS
jgi:hypothetical protein